MCTVAEVPGTLSPGSCRFSFDPVLQKTQTFVRSPPLLPRFTCSLCFVIAFLVRFVIILCLLSPISSLFVRTQRKMLAGLINSSTVSVVVQPTTTTSAIALSPFTNSGFSRYSIASAITPVTPLCLCRPAGVSTLSGCLCSVVMHWKRATSFLVQTGCLRAGLFPVTTVLDYWIHHSQTLRRCLKVTIRLPMRVSPHLILLRRFSDLPQMGPVATIARLTSLLSRKN